MATSSPRRRQVLAALSAAALLSATACGGGSSDSSSSRTGSAKLALAIMGSPPSFDVTQIATNQAAYIWGALYDTLLSTDNKGQIQSNAAEKHEYSADHKTLTLTLHKGMTFTSGAAVNAAAVKATLDRVRSTPGPSQQFLASIASIETPDESTVVLKLKEPDGALLTSLSQSGGVIADPATMTQPTAAANPVGSGPYTLDKSSTVSGSTYTLAKRKDYWNAAAYPFDTVRIRVMGDRSAVTNALLAGELNAGSVDWTQAPAMKAKGLTLTPVKATAVASLILADRKGEVSKPLGDLRVRQAINMAFDRTKLTGTFLRGSGQASTQVYNSLGKAYDPALDRAYPFDVTKAKKLLADAGYPDGFALTLPSFATTKVFEPTVAQSLTDIGIKVSWTPVPPQQQTQALTSKKYPAYFIIEGLTTDAATTVTFFSPQSGRNPFAITDPELTRLMTQANTTDDPTSAYKKISAFAVKNAWFAPVFQIGADYVTGQGVKFLGDGSNTFSTIRAFGTG